MASSHTQGKKLLLLCRTPPYGSNTGNACLDLLLTAAAFDQDVTLALAGDGVLQLLRDQDSRVIGVKNLSRSFPALELYGVKKVVVEAKALPERRLSREDLVIPVDLIETPRLAELMEECDQVLLF